MVGRGRRGEGQRGEEGRVKAGGKGKKEAIVGLGKVMDGRIMWCGGRGRCRCMRAAGDDQGQGMLPPRCCGRLTGFYFYFYFYFCYLRMNVQM